MGSQFRDFIFLDIYRSAFPNDLCTQCGLIVPQFDETRTKSTHPNLSQPDWLYAPETLVGSYEWFESDTNILTIWLSPTIQLCALQSLADAHGPAREKRASALKVTARKEIRVAKASEGIDAPRTSYCAHNTTIAQTVLKQSQIRRQQLRREELYVIWAIC